jgi:ribonuclease BN (tRNA processing enzyme)
MPDLEFTFLGTGNAFAPGGLCWNGFLVNRRFLFEAPPQALMSLHRVGVDPNSLEAVIVSHHHADHFLGLAFVLLHWRYQGRKAPVKIVGPTDTEKLSHELFEKVYPGVFEVGFPLEWVEVGQGDRLQLDGLTVEPLEVVHDDRLSASLGYACELGGKRFAYTGDSAMCDSVLELARRSDILICECASVEDKIAIHMNLREDIPNVRKAMPADATLVLTHLGPGVEPNGMKNTIAAQDLKSYCL